jgi:serine/threonine-protein kinase PRP4
MRPERHYYKKSSNSSRRSRSRSPSKRRNDEYGQNRRDGLRMQQEKYRQRSRSRLKIARDSQSRSFKNKEKSEEKFKETSIKKEVEQLSDNEELDIDIPDEEENEEEIIERRRKERENLLKKLHQQQQQQENQSKFIQQSPQIKDSLSDDESEDIVQFDFETSIIDKKECVSKNQTQNQQNDADDLLDSCNRSKMKETNEKSKGFDMFADDDYDFQNEKHINNEKTQEKREDNPNLADNWDDHEGYYSRLFTNSLF